MKNTRTAIVISIALVCMLLLSACAPASSPASTQPSAESATATVTATQPPAATEEPSAAVSEAPSPTVSETVLPSAPSEDIVAQPFLATLTVTGEITEVMDQTDQIRVVSDNEMDSMDEVTVNMPDEIIVYDAKSDRFVDYDTLKVGDRVQVTISGLMTKSMPPISNGFLIVTNLSEDGLGLPIYTKAEEVTVNEDGSAAVLNQNKDTIVTIPSDMMLAVLDYEGEKEANDIQPAQIKQGDVLLVWYDFVAMSMPAQATATKAMLIVQDV